MSIRVKRAFKYRFCPTDAQAAELSRTFGCVRKVYNMALAARTEAWARQERVNYNQPSAMLTAWKKTEELAFLNEVSSVPLQQTLRLNRRAPGELATDQLLNAVFLRKGGVDLDAEGL
ncbi:transposase, partial [Streptomyces mirabilis]|uniref:transposase n=1 Tax=Streptomyces mirabilis TaxID=68239 RepID=UPI0034056F5F